VSLTPELIQGVLRVAAYILASLEVLTVFVLLLRMAWIRILPAYPWVSAFLLVNILQHYLRRGFPAYNSEVYYAGNVLRLALLIPVLWDLCRHAFAQHPALAAFARRAAVHVIGGSLVIAWVGWLLNPDIPPNRTPFYHNFLRAELAVNIGLLAFVVALGAFVAWFPVTMKRNALVHITGFSIYFGMRWLVLMVMNVAPVTTNLMNVVEQTFAMGGLLYWACMVSRAGETATTVTGLHWNREEAGRISRQLDNINSSLVRFYQ
jgi:hypothetical protein